MITYISPQISSIWTLPATIIAVSVIDGGSANQEIPIQVKEEDFFHCDWDNFFAE